MVNYNSNIQAPAMHESVSIRSCIPQDAEAILSLGIRTFRDTFDEMNTAENMMLYLSKNFTLKKIRKELSEPHSVFFIAEADDTAIGYARVRANKPEGSTEEALEIERIYADKKFIGKRVGYLLMNTCLHYAREHGYGTVWLGVWEHNKRAIAFYEKWGFEKFSSHPFLVGNDLQTDLMMKKNL